MTRATNNPLREQILFLIGMSGDLGITAMNRRSRGFK